MNLQQEINEGFKKLAANAQQMMDYCDVEIKKQENEGIGYDHDPFWYNAKERAMEQKHSAELQILPLVNID